MTLSTRFTAWMLAASFLISSCQPAATPFPTPTYFPTLTATPVTPTSTPLPPTPEPPTLTPTPDYGIPNFSHIVIIIFENKEFGYVIGNSTMPFYNQLADSNTILTQYYAVTHPSLPNYISLIGGDTFGVIDDCDFRDCHTNAASLPDLIEASGRTWKTYQQGMKEPCLIKDVGLYVRKHNPFIFFDPIRSNQNRCEQSVVPLPQLDDDLAQNNLPNYIFITPDLCYSAHDCELGFSDDFLKEVYGKLQPALEASGQPYLIVLTWDEGQGTHSCCGLPELAGGRIATVLVSPQVKSNFQDDTPYSHYSLLKTISAAWGLPYLGHAADDLTSLILAPWK